MDLGGGDSSTDNGAGKYLMTLSLLFNSANTSLSVILHERKISLSVSIYVVSMLQN